MSYTSEKRKRDEEAKTSRAAAKYKCVCGCIKPKWLSEERCSYCVKVGNRP